MAVPAKPVRKESLEAVYNDPIAPTPVGGPELTPLQKHVARLYSLGVPRRQIVRALVDHLAPGPRPIDQRLTVARRKVRRWEANQKFRDAIWQQAVVDLDMAMPGVLKGVTAKAKRGRVDAAKLVLEISGRHTPRGEGTAPNIVVAINGIPRPAAPGYDVDVLEKDITEEP